MNYAAESISSDSKPENEEAEPTGQCKPGLTRGTSDKFILLNRGQAKNTSGEANITI